MPEDSGLSSCPTICLSTQTLTNSHVFHRGHILSASSLIPSAAGGEEDGIIYSFHWKPMNWGKSFPFSVPRSDHTEPSDVVRQRAKMLNTATYEN